MEYLVRVSKADEAKLPIRASSLYKWHHLGRYPQIFRKLGGYLFVDLRELERLIDAQKPRPEEK
ncbi:MAG: hypothetical protein K6T55_12370 [Syntrophobacterales bacterium]|nr:hypothetical protein [Syntrophobacterales bacterium]